MADSEISTSLSSVTRRRLLAGTAALAIPWSNGKTALDVPIFSRLDPVVPLWRAWKKAQSEAISACRHQQGLENELLARLRHRESGFDSQDRNGLLEIRAGEDGLQNKRRPQLGPGSETALMSDPADVTLVEGSEWGGSVGAQYADAKRTELLAADHEQMALERLLATPATTVLGVVGKLDAVICDGQPSEDSNEFPWPQLRSTVSDLKRIALLLQPEELSAVADLLTEERD